MKKKKEVKEKNRIIANISKHGNYLMVYIPKKVQKHFSQGEFVLLGKLVPIPLSVIAKVSKHGEYLTVYVPKEFHNRFKEKEKVLISKLLWSTS